MNYFTLKKMMFIIKGIKMTKMKRVSLVFVIIMVMSALIIYFINCTNIKYDISDAVTYFDEQGRYQLVNSVN